VKRWVPIGGAIAGLVCAGVLVAESASFITVGRQPNGSVVTSTDQTLTPAGRQTEFRGRPAAVALSPGDFPGFVMTIPDQYRVEIFLREFNHYVATGSLPNLITMTLPDDHTSGLTSGIPDPTHMVADNDLALGRIVEAISKSRTGKARRYSSWRTMLRMASTMWTAIEPSAT
jgi:hypothetical protein